MTSKPRAKECTASPSQAEGMTTGVEKKRKLSNYWGGPFLRACFFLRFEDQKRVPSLSYCFASIFIGLRLSRPALKPASKLALRCFVLMFMVSRHWSSRLALRPAFNFVHLINFLFCCNFHQLEASRLALRPSLCASCGLKF